MSDTINDAPLKITINGQEFDPEEAEALIETGQKTRDLEQRYNTKLDNVWPEYNRSQQTRKQLEQELAEAKSQLTDFTSKQKEGAETTEDVVKAREAAKKLGIVLDNDLSEGGYIKKDDLEKYFEERESQKAQVKKVLDSADKLESEINGSDGRPKFDKRVVLAFASAYNYSDLQQAYEDMHKDALAPWKEAQIAAQKAKSLKTLGNNGEKSPSSPKINDSNVKQALREALYGAEE